MLGLTGQLMNNSPFLYDSLVQANCFKNQGTF